DNEELASTSHVPETNLLPQKPTYKEALQSAAGIDKPIHTKIITTKCKENGHAKEVQSFEDAFFSYGLKEGALG
ncbi:hypothetical protein U1Q18_029568, partial [Sarracenia purpurea var. burkii]